jgi:UDP-glucose 4-epimerase
MKILITGALGHIGSRFIHNLHPADYDRVVLLDNLSTQRYCSLFNLPEGVPFQFVEDDVCTANLEGYFESMDVVIHLAAITNAAASFEIQDQVELVNFEGTECVARACVKTGSKLIFLSTTSVYGTQKDIVDEDCSLEELKPQSPYAASKLRAEQLLQALGQSDGLKFFIGRFGTIFGTSIGMRFHTAINKFCWQACVGRPITVWRTALHQKRPYLDLGDGVRALDFILRTGRFDNQVYNVVTENTTVGQIVDLIRIHVQDVQIEYVDSRIMNQLSYTVACNKFQALGFQFKGNLAQGIEDTIRLIRGIKQNMKC